MRSKRFKCINLYRFPLENCQFHRNESDGFIQTNQNSVGIDRMQSTLICMQHTKSEQSVTAITYIIFRKTRTIFNNFNLKDNN